MKLLLENWREFMNESKISKYDMLADVLIDQIKKREDYVKNKPWGLIHTLLRTADHRRNSQFNPLMKLRQSEDPYMDESESWWETIDQVVEKIKNFIIGHEVEIIDYDDPRTDPDTIIGRKGKVVDVQFHGRNRPVMVVEWYTTGDWMEDEVGHALNQSTAFSDIRMDGWYGGNIVSSYKIDPVKPLSPSELMRFLEP